MEAHELLANLYLEDSDTKKATAEADKAIEISPDALDAMAIHAAVELLGDKSPDAWLDKIKRVNLAYGEGYSRIACFSDFQTAATTMVPLTIAKRLRLIRNCGPRIRSWAVNLMRLAQVDEVRQQLELAYNNSFRDAATVNSLRLIDSYKNFVTIKDETPRY